MRSGEGIPTVDTALSLAPPSLLSKIKEHAADRCGFIIAFRSSRPPEGYGFSFLATKNDSERLFVALHGVAEGRYHTLQLGEASFSLPSGLSDMLFFEEYFRMAAHIGNMEYASMIGCLSSLQHIWRCSLFADGRPDFTSENSRTWRPLWIHLAEAAKEKRFPYNLPEDAIGLLSERLGALSRDAQTVLRP